MRKNLFGSFSFVSVLVATALVGFETQIAMACSSGGASGPGLSHGSSLGSGSVTVCVGSTHQSSGSSITQTITKTVVVKVPEKKKSAKKKASKVATKSKPKPAPKPAQAPAPPSCPSSAQLASMPKSADAAERWISGICSPPAKSVVTPKPATKAAPKPKQKLTTKTVTETVIINVPGHFSSKVDKAEFFPNPLRAFVAPESVLGVGQVASFSSNPAPHYGFSKVLGRQAQVYFVPVESGWSFSDGMSRRGVETSRFFEELGTYQVRAWVQYRVSYRLLGESGWKEVPGQLTINSNNLEVTVGAKYPKVSETRQGVLLVGADCEGRSGVFGCDL